MEQLTIPMLPDGHTRHQDFFCTSCGTHPLDNGGDSPLFFREDFIRLYDSNGLARCIRTESHHDSDAVYCEVCGEDGNW